MPEPAACQPALAIVGEAPGRHEVEHGRPFVGASGRMLGRGLRTLGLTRSAVHWTNAILCDCSTAQDAMSAARKCCAERLRQELGAVAPAVVVPVGAWGLQSTLGLGRKPQALAWRGSISLLQLDSGSGAPCFVCPTIHPAFAMRAERWKPVLELDFERIGRVLRDGWSPPEAQHGRRILVARTVDDLGAYLRQLQGPELGFDVETVGLGPTETDLVCFALSDGSLTVVVPWSRSCNGQELWLPGWAGAVRAEWRRLQRCTFVTHNGPAFDHLVAERYGLHVERWEDTLLAYHALCGWLPKNLAHVVTQYLDVGPWKQWEHSRAIEDLWTYNARDTLYTVLAWREMRGKVKP